MHALVAVRMLCGTHNRQRLCAAVGDHGAGSRRCSVLGCARAASRDASKGATARRRRGWLQALLLAVLELRAEMPGKGQQRGGPGLAAWCHGYTYPTCFGACGGDMQPLGGFCARARRVCAVCVRCCVYGAVCVRCLECVVPRVSGAACMCGSL
eukprot:357102-Chlamydomonas_euryale.AAC.2